MKAYASYTAEPLRVFRYDPTETGLRRWLGELEACIMDALWSEGRPLTVEAVTRLVSGRAYTTIGTTLNRMTEKGLVTRTLTPGGGGPGAYVFRAAEEREVFIARQIAAIEESL